MKKLTERASAIFLSLSLSLAPALPALAQGADGLPSEVTGEGKSESKIESTSSSATPASVTSTATTSSTTSTTTSSSTTSAGSDSSYVDPVIVKPVIDLPHIKEGSVTTTSTSTKSAAPAAQARQAPVQHAAATTTKLYGRIEQITSSNGASFPIILKAMTPKLDTSMQQKPLKGATADTSLFSGVVAKSFPTDYRGNWGGDLTVWRVEQDPICYRIDPEEASKVLKIFKTGAKGSTNFDFTQSTGGITLVPAKVMFQVPGKDVGAEKQLDQMLGGQGMASMGPMAAMMKQMAQSMPVPVIFSFGDIQSSQTAKGLSGNDFVQRTLKNQVRELAPNVLEQQIVAQCDEVMKSTGQPRRRYEESVLRFTKVNSQQMYVQAAQVVFGQDRKFQQKIVMYGYVTKGQVANTNPYSGMMQMMQPGQAGSMPSQMQGIPGLQPGQNPFGSGQLQLPPGFNPFQGLFGQ